MIYIYIYYIIYIYIYIYIVSLNVSGEILKTFNHEGLKEDMGIESIIHRTFILDTIKSLSEDAGPSREVFGPQNYFPSNILSQLEKNFVLGALQTLYTAIIPLYNAQKEEFSIDKFHKSCDGKAPTLIIAKSTEEHIFGGFSTIPWVASEGGKGETNWMWNTENRSFLFSVTHKTTHHFIGGREVYLQSNYGPTFGSGFDLHIYQKQGSRSNLGASYALPQGVEYMSLEAREYLAGEYMFTLDNYEVFYLKK